ncbi:MAG: SIS domain-containing protein [Saprospiraceae bacterium]|nr:SIS domain-containing protein [Saprospiraceae bacterium]
MKRTLLEDERMISAIHAGAGLLIQAFKSDGKVLFCGNGGSAADAQHLSAELSGKYYLDRPPLQAEALHVNTSFLTAVANDYSFDETYARLVTGSARLGDVVIGLSTSGNSKNIVNALKEAKKIGCTTIGLTGKGGGELAAFCDLWIAIPSENTPRIQECHMIIGHTICEIVEKELFSNQ